MNIADYGFAIWETFYVTVLSTAFALVLGLPLGVLLVAGDKDGILPLPGWLMHLINIASAFSEKKLAVSCVAEKPAIASK